MKRLRVLYAGRVQGVGFRANVQKLATNFDLTGRVCNLTDGRVELIVEGEPTELKRFVDRVAIEMRAYIVSQTNNSTPAQQHWHDFAIAPDKQPESR